MIDLSVITIFVWIQLYRHTKLGGIFSFVLSPIITFIALAILSSITSNPSLHFLYNGLGKFITLGILLLIPDYKSIFPNNFSKNIYNYFCNTRRTNTEKLAFYGKIENGGLIIGFVLGLTSMPIFYYFSFSIWWGILIWFIVGGGAEAITKKEIEFIKNQIKEQEENDLKIQAQQKKLEKEVELKRERNDKIRMQEAKNRAKELEIEENKSSKQKLNKKTNGSIEEIQNLLDD